MSVTTAEYQLQLFLHVSTQIIWSLLAHSFGLNFSPKQMVGGYGWSLFRKTRTWPFLLGFIDDDDDWWWWSGWVFVCFHLILFTQHFFFSASCHKLLIGIPKWEDFQRRADETSDMAACESRFNLCNRGRLLSCETTPFGAVLVKNQRRVNRTCLSSVSTLILSLQRNPLPVLCTQKHLNTRWFAAQSLITSFSTELTLHSLLLIFHYGWGCGSTFTISTAIRDSVLVNRW